MYRIILSIVFCVYSFALDAQNQQTKSDQNINQNLDSFFQYCYDNDLFNGSVLIYKENQILLKKSYGKADHKSDTSISSDTAFLLASISKQFTAFGIVLLESKGQLNYDDYVKNHLIDFPYPDITIRHLLNHTSGLPNYEAFLNPQFKELQNQYEEKGTTVTNERISTMIAKRKPPLAFSAGTNFDYSNTGYLYLALIIESISGKSYAQYLNEKIFKPLNMNNSWALNKDKSARKERAIGYKKNYIDNTTNENEVPDFLKVYGDGGIYSSANDLQKWYTSLDSHTLVSENELEEVYKTPIINEDKAPYGFGWFVRVLPFNKHRALTHSGKFMGFTNSLFRDLDNKTTSIILSNNSHDINSEINRAVVRILYHMPYEKPRLGSEMVLGNMILLNGIEKAKAFYKLHKENELYNFSEKSINSLGYNFLSRDNKNIAIDVLKWNVELYQESGNVYDSLGEAFLAIDNKKEALKNYEKAFNLDPSNTNAEKIITKLKME